MKTSLLTPKKDPMGAAIADFYAKGQAAKLRVLSSMFDEDEIPVNQLFRTFDEMPSLEQTALQSRESNCPQGISMLKPHRHLKLNQAQVQLTPCPCTP